MFEAWLVQGLLIGLAVGLFLFLLWRSRRKRGSLGNQLRLTFVGVAAISLLVIVGGLIWQIRNTLITQTGQSFFALATANSQRLGVELAREIDLLHSLSEDEIFLNRITRTSETELGLLSSSERRALLRTRERHWRNQTDPDLRTTVLRNAASSVLNTFQSNFPAHVELLVIDRYGGLVAGRAAPPFEIEHYYYGDRPWWQTIRQAGAAGAIYIGHPHLIPDERQTAIDIALPLRPPVIETAPRGVLRSEFIIQSLQLFADANPPGESGELLLVDEMGVILYSSNPDRIGNHLSGELETEPAGDQWRLIQDESGQRLIRSQAPLIAPSAQPELNTLAWRIIVQQTEAEALGTVNRLSQMALAGGLLSLILAIVVSKYLTHQFTRPIKELTNVAAAMAGGQLDRVARVSGPIELRTLAQAFNSMTAQLQESFTTLQASEEKFRTLFENSKDAIIITTAGGQILDVNPACLELFGVTRAEMMSLNAQTAYKQPADRLRFREAVIKHGSVKDFEVKFLKKDGTEIDCLLTSTVGPAGDEQADPIFQTIIRDITERKRAAEALASERNLLRTLIDSLPDHIYVKDTRNTFLMANKTVAQASGFQEPDELVGKTDADFHPPELAKQYRADEQAIIASGQPLINREEPLLDQEKGERWLLTTKAPFRDSQGEIVGLVGINRDITERKQAEQLLREHSQTLEQKVHERTAQLEEKVEEIATLNLITQTIVSIPDMETSLRIIAQAMAKLFNARHSSIALIDEARTELTVVAKYPPGSDQAPDVDQIIPATEKPYFSRVIETGQSLVISDAQPRPLTEETPNSGRTQQPICSMILPLLTRGRVIGIIDINSNQSQCTFTQNEVKLAETIAGQLGGAIESARLFIQTQTTNQHLKALNERLQSELALAQKIQQGLLPAPHPNWSDLDVVCYSVPAREVGGDFYSYHAFPSPSVSRGTHPSASLPNERQPLPLAHTEGTLSSHPAAGGNPAPTASAAKKPAPLPPAGETKKRGRYAVTVGDVSGKGVSAALLMATSLSQFDATLPLNLSPSERLVYLDNAILPYAKPRRQNCAMCYVELELGPNGDTAQLRIVNAGCIPPYIKRATGELEELEVGGFALGQGLGAQFGYREIGQSLTRGDLVILTSDGVVEAYNPAKKIFGFDRLKEAVATGPTTGAEAMLAHLRAKINAFVEGAEPHDDVTIVVVQV